MTDLSAVTVRLKENSYQERNSDMQEANSFSNLYSHLHNEVSRLTKSKELEEHGNVTDVLIGLKFADGHIHIHYPVEHISIEVVSAIMKHQKEKLDDWK